MITTMPALVRMLLLGPSMATNPSNEDAPVTADKDQKCAHPSCACMVPPNHEFGKYCSEHCDDAGEIDELVCECGHDACRAGLTP